MREKQRKNSYQVFERRRGKKSEVLEGSIAMIILILQVDTTIA